MDKTKKFQSIDFEVFGKVQGVFFRKYTKEAADKYSIVGWCQNTNTGTVIGQAQGEKAKMDQMKKWLKEVGSPKSKIEKCVFINEKSIDKLEFKGFDIKRDQVIYIGSLKKSERKPPKQDKLIMESQNNIKWLNIAQ